MNLINLWRNPIHLFLALRSRLSSRDSALHTSAQSSSSAGGYKHRSLTYLLAFLFLSFFPS